MKTSFREKVGGGDFIGLKEINYCKSLTLKLISCYKTVDMRDYNGKKSLLLSQNSFSLLPRSKFSQDQDKKNCKIPCDSSAYKVYQD